MKKALSLILALIMVMSLVACGGKNDTANDKTNTGTTQQQPPKQEEQKAPTEIKVEATEKTEDAKYAEEVTLALGVGALDPGDGWNAERDAYQRFVFDSLYMVNDSTGEVEMQLAKSVDWVDDKFNALKVVLRDDIHFSNGEKITTADVEFSLGRNTYANMTSYYDHSEILSDTEMIIHMKKPYRDFYSVLGLSCASIVSKAETEKNPDGLALIGSGPFVYDMDSYVAASSISMVRNENYWGEFDSPTKKINIVKIADKSAAAIALQKGEINFMVAANDNEIPQLEAADSVTVQNYASYGYIYVAFNDFQDTAAVSEEDLNFRRAVACAINRDDILIGIGGGSHQTAIWPYDHPGYGTNEDYEYDLSYNPEKAKEYLAAAGGKTEFTALVDTSKAYLKVSSQIIQEQLKQVGITLNIEETDSTGFTAMSKWGVAEYDAIIHNNLFAIRAGSYGLFNKGANTNRAAAYSEELMSYVEGAQTALTDEAQYEQQKNIHKYFNKTCSYVPLVWRFSNFAYTTGLENFAVSAGPCYYMRDIALRLN